MDLLLAAADIGRRPGPAARSRSWPSSGLPAVLVPLPIAPRDHQTANARRLATPARPSWCPTPSSTTERLVDEVDGAARRPGAAGRDGRGRCAAPPTPTPPTASPRWSRRTPEWLSRGCTVDLDPSTPRRIHVVGIGGAGMSAIAACWRRWATRCRAATSSDSPASSGSAAAGVEVAVGHDAAQPRRASTPSPSRPRSRRPTPRSAAAAERGIPVLRRAEMLAAIAAHPAHGRGGRHPRQDHDLVDARAGAARRPGCEPSFIVGGEVNEIGSGAAWDDGEWFVVEADESDGTFLELGAEVAVVTNVEPDHLEHYGDVRRARGRVRPLPRRGAGSPRGVRRRPGAAAAGRRPSAPSPTARADGGRLPHRRRRRRARRARAFTLVHGGERARRRSELPVPGLHNARNAAAAVVTGARARRRRSPPRPRRSARFAGVGPPLRVPRRGRRRHLRRRLRPPARPRSRPLLAAARDGGWRRVVCVFQPHRYTPHRGALARLRRRVRRRRRRSSSPTSTPAGEAPRPGRHRQAGRRRRARRPPAAAGSAWLPAPRRLVAYLAAELRPGDLCLTLGAGDLTTLPDELLGALGRRAAAPS